MNQLAKIDFGDGLSIVGSSISGHWSCIAIPSMSIAFDMGWIFAESLACDTVLITHGHSDHISALPQHARIRTMRGDKRATYIMPTECIRQVVGGCFVARRCLVLFGFVWFHMFRSFMSCSPRCLHSTIICLTAFPRANRENC